LLQNCSTSPPHSKTMVRPLHADDKVLFNQAEQEYGELREAYLSS